MDSLQILWETEKAETPRIEKYLLALLHALHAAGLTLAEAKWMMVRESETLGGRLRRQKPVARRPARDPRLAPRDGA